MRFTPKHWMALGLFLTGVATQMGGLTSWRDCTSITFFAGIVMQLGSVLVAAASDKLFKD